MTAEKRCTRCGRVKPASQYWRHRREPDGLQPWCRDCRLAYQRGYMARTPRKSPGRSRYPELNDRAWLLERYCHELLTIREIALQLGCNVCTVRGALKRHQIPAIADQPRRVLRAAAERAAAAEVTA